jgi:hypothetical protein
MIARFTNKELARVVEYLLTKNRILRSKLPKRIEVTPAEQAKLVKLGKHWVRKLKKSSESFRPGPSHAG